MTIQVTLMDNEVIEIVGTITYSGNYILLTHDSRSEVNGETILKIQTVPIELSRVLVITQKAALIKPENKQSEEDYWKK